MVYRVNTAVEHTNAAGDNYMYVFRPGTQDSRGARETYTVTGADGTATEVNAVQKAAVGTASRPTLGNADMSAPCTADTIFYDDGTNSGIVINNVSFSNGKANSMSGIVRGHLWLPQGDVNVAGTGDHRQQGWNEAAGLRVNRQVCTDGRMRHGNR